MRHLLVVSLVMIAAASSGCSTGCPSCATDDEIHNLVHLVPVAGTVGSARHLAKCIEDDLNARTEIAEGDKVELRARAQVLAAHADKISDAMDRYDPAKGNDQAITLSNLNARATALEEEYRFAFREWGVWQVKHGLRKPEEVWEVFDYAEAMGG